MRSLFSLTALCAVGLMVAACGEEETAVKKETMAPVKKVEAPAPKSDPMLKETEKDKNLDMTPKEALENMQKDAVAVADKAQELVAKATAAVENAVSTDGDVEHGAAVFKKCKACHNAEDGAKNKVGPNLFGVVGRVAGSVDGFKYSKAMSAFDQPWQTSMIVEYVADPSAFLKKVTADQTAKSKMTFKLQDEQSRKDVAAYLATLR